MFKFLKLFLWLDLLIFITVNLKMCSEDNWRNANSNLEETITEITEILPEQ